MEGKVYEIPLDVADGALKVQVIVLVTEDLGTNTFRFNLVKNKRIPFDLTGTIVRMMVKTPSGARIQQECVVENALGGALRLTLKQSLLTERGSHIAELQVFDAITQSIRLTTPTFNYHVRQSLQNSDSIVATDEYTILQQTLADLAGINIVVANKADKDYVDTELADVNRELNKNTTSNKITGRDNRDVPTKPSDYTDELKFTGLKNGLSIGLTDEFTNVLGLNSWADTTAGVYEMAFNPVGIHTRQRENANSWQPWKQLATTESTTLTPLNGWTPATYTYPTISKVGNVCTLNATLVGGAINGYTPIFSLPSQYVKSGTLFNLIAHSEKSNVLKTNILRIHSTGQVDFIFSLAEGETLFITASYSL